MGVFEWKLWVVFHTEIGNALKTKRAVSPYHNTNRYIIIQYIFILQKDNFV
jgi:hypothetical protein